MTTHVLKHGPSQGQCILDFVHAPYSDLPTWKRFMAQFSIVGFELGFQLVGFAAMCALPVMTYLRVIPSVLSGILALWSIAEWLFLFWNVKWIRELESHRPSMLFSSQRRFSFINKMAGHVDLERALPLWSNTAVKGWSFFDKLQLLYKSQMSILHREVCMNESQNVDIFCPTFEPLVCKPKPLTFYALMRGYIYMVESKLKCLGLNKYAFGNIHCWKYQSVQETDAQPIIFIHGVGCGPGTYISQITKLIEHHPNCNIYVLELPCIVAGTFADIPTIDEILASIDDFFVENSLQQCSFIGHSYGAIVCTWLNYHRPQYINSLTLIDPVCFNLFESQFIKKCLYQDPSCFIHDFSLYVVFRDPLLASVLSRNFWWHQNLLFPEDIKAKTNVYLSELDWIIDTPAVLGYLQHQLAVNPNPNVTLHMAHCEYIFNSKVLDAICLNV